MSSTAQESSSQAQFMQAVNESSFASYEEVLLANKQDENEQLIIKLDKAHKDLQVVHQQKEDVQQLCQNQIDQLAEIQAILSQNLIQLKQYKEQNRGLFIQKNIFKERYYQACQSQIQKQKKIIQLERNNKIVFDQLQIKQDFNAKQEWKNQSLQASEHENNIKIYKLEEDIQFLKQTIKNNRANYIEDRKLTILQLHYQRQKCELLTKQNQQMQKHKSQNIKLHREIQKMRQLIQSNQSDYKQLAIKTTAQSEQS